RGADESWLKKKDKLSMHFSGYLFLSIIICSIWVPLKIGSPFFLFGVVLYLLTMVFSLYTSKSFVQAPKDKVIQNRMYRYSRNPIYLGNFFIVITMAF
ncbi:MAG: hypothetical protein Q4Q13_06940, partial [Vagococcus sp.]|nr:hypothetical protein [Vagococcus sp.]